MGAADKLKAACEVVNTYVLALKQEHVPFAAMPSECGNLFYFAFAIFLNLRCINASLSALAMYSYINVKSCSLA